MPSYLLRVAAVNLDDFVFEVDDLSPIRGASLMLLNAVRDFWEAFGKAFPEYAGLEVISTGASTGVFRFEAAGDDEAEALRSSAARFLLHHKRLQFATFAVDVIEESEPFDECLQKLRVKGRWRQMRQPSVALRFPQPSGDAEPCAIDGVRVATERSHDKEDHPIRVSASALARKRYGIEQKQRFYAHEVERSQEPPPELEDRKFVMDLDTLTARPEGPRHPLHHKMAVIYADGNSFGKLRSAICQSAADLRRFDEALAGQRAGMLADLLRSMEADGEWRTGASDLRLETLLWGGDEFTWVVPAWKGWEALGHFYGRSYEVEGRELEHAAGIVFCHHNAPIHRIVQLAHDLADVAKRACRERSLVAYQVLESFDHVGRDLSRYRRRRRPAGVEEREMLFEGSALFGQLVALGGVREAVSRTKLYALVSDLLGSAASDEKPPADRQARARSELEARLRDADPKAFDNLVDAFGASEDAAEPPRIPEWVWLHLLELWDYLPTAGPGGETA